MTAARFWFDDFDMDLPRVIPLDDALGSAADIRLWTHGNTTHGRLNHPSVWNEGADFVAYFGTSPNVAGKPAWYYSDWPVVECTWREVVRDAWVHTYIVVVDGVTVWDAARLRDAFDDLMGDMRGDRKLPDGEADRVRADVFASPIVATADLTQHIEAVFR